MTQEVAGHRLTAQVAGFYDTDTSGTLLTFRGWGLDGARMTLNAAIPLPDFGSNHSHPGQYDEAQPQRELDGRPGGYVRLEWRPPAPVAVEASYYDNAGDPHRFIDGQWDWRTTFGDVGVTWRPAPGWEVLGQGMFGRTYFGDHTPLGWYVDVIFRAAYLLATRHLGAPPLDRAGGRLQRGRPLLQGGRQQRRARLGAHRRLRLRPHRLVEPVGRGDPRTRTAAPAPTC